MAKVKIHKYSNMSSKVADVTVAHEQMHHSVAEHAARHAARLDAKRAEAGSAAAMQEGAARHASGI